jgi:hypothetical protein
MTESFESMLSEGYRTWRKNMELGIPFILNAIAMITAIVIGAVLFGVLFFILILSNMSPIVLVLLALFLIAFTLVLMLISAFFSAGAIGMALKATESGKTSLGDMLEYGKKKAADIFLANLLVAFSMTLFGIILIASMIAPLLLKSPNIALSVAAFDLVLLVLCSVLLYFVLSPVSYAIVLSDLSAVDGVSAGYRFFMENKIATILLLFTVSGVYYGYSMITDVISSLFGVIPLLGTLINIGVSLLAALFSMLVIQPIVTVWWTRLYLGRNGIKKMQEPIAPNLEAVQPSSGTQSSGPYYV